MRNKPWFLCVVMVAMLLLSAGGCNRTNATRKHRIVIVTKALDSEFWQTLKSGAEEAAIGHLPGCRPGRASVARETRDP